MGILKIKQSIYHLFLTLKKKIIIDGIIRFEQLCQNNVVLQGKINHL